MSFSSPPPQQPSRICRLYNSNFLRQTLTQMLASLLFTCEFSLVWLMLNFAAAAAASAGSTAFKILHPSFDCQLFTYSYYSSRMRRRWRRNTYSNEHSSRKRCRNITLKRMRFTQLFTYLLLTIYRHNKLTLLVGRQVEWQKLSSTFTLTPTFHFEAELLVLTCNSRTVPLTLLVLLFFDETILGFVFVPNETCLSVLVMYFEEKEIKRFVSQWVLV